MESLLIANQIKHLEEQVSSIQQSIHLLKDLLITASNDSTKNDTIKTLIEPSQPVITREQYVKEILTMVKNELGWTIQERKPGYYWFTKKGKCIPLILENHSSSERVRPAYITTQGWRRNKMCWTEYKDWTNQQFNDYKNMIQLLGWETFGNTRTCRYRIDGYDLAMDKIKDLFNTFANFV